MNSIFNGLKKNSLWFKTIHEKCDSSVISHLEQFLMNETECGKIIYPNNDLIFRSLNLVDYSDVKVVIIGQDPYHGHGEANGLAFAVNNGVKIPPSLRNIFKELEMELNKSIVFNSSLLGWASQGVLLLNTTLTVEKDSPRSHHKKGWEVITNAIVKEIGLKKAPVVFMLWGKDAQDKENLIKNKEHLILKSPHPSPLSAHRGFFGNNHFTLANEYLKNFGTHIKWELME